jgi:hypothetical protein
MGRLPSAGLGLVVAVCLTFESAAAFGAGVVGLSVSPFLILLVVTFVLVAYWLETTKDNAIQSWLENCIFGIGNTYKDGNFEMKELSRALS